MSKRPGTSVQIEIHFTVPYRFYHLFSIMKLVETYSNYVFINEK